MAPQATDGTPKRVTTHPVQPTTQDRLSLSVRGLLAARRLSVVALAAGIDTTPQAVFRRLAGTTPWRVGEADAIAAWFGLPLDEMLATGDRLAQPAEKSA